MARWLDTYAITDRALPSLSSGLPGDELRVFLRGNAIQALVQELLAARLTDAPEAEAVRLSKLFTVSGQGVLPDAELAALFDVFDEQICALAVRVSGAEPELLHRIRQDAYLARVVATIDRHAAACEVRPDSTVDRDFVARYRRHATDFHGRLQPPDSERRRLIPIDDLYVSPAVSHMIEAEPGKPLPRTDIWRLDNDLDHAADRGYGEPAVDRELQELGVRTVAIPRKAKISAARRDIEHARGFRRLVKWRTGCEDRISYIKRRYGWDRTRLDRHEGASIWCGHGVFAHNLVKISTPAS